MATQPTPIRPKPGIQRDGTRFDCDQYNDGQWVRWSVGRPKKIGGYRQVTSHLPEVSRGLHAAYADGTVRLHSGGKQYLAQSSSFQGVDSGYNDRTPSLLTNTALNSWTFDQIYDPFANNKLMLLAHASQSLTEIDSTTEAPVFWGGLSDTTPLIPLAIPTQTTAFTVATLTGTTATSDTVTAISSTAALTFGMIVTGAGIPAATYIKQIVSGTSIKLSQAATASATVSLTFTVGGPSGGIMSLRPYVMHFGSNGKVGWSAPSSPNDFWSTGSGEAYVTGQKIVRGLPMRAGPGTSPSGLLWSLDSLVRVTFSGGASTFSFDEVSNAITILSPHTPVEMDGVYYWAGVDRFFMFNGAVRELPNPTNKVWFFKNINRAHAQKAFAFRNAGWGEIWFCAPLFGATECSHAVIYNDIEKCWYDTVLPNGGRSAAVPATVTPYPYMAGLEVSTVTDGYSIWQHETGVDEYRSTGAVAVQSYFETNDITLLTGDQPKSQNLRVAKIEPDFIQSGDMVVSVLGNYNARSPDVESMRQTIPENPTPDQQLIGFKETRRQMRFRFESNVAGGDYWGGKTLAHVEPADTRETG